MLHNNDFVNKTYFNRKLIDVRKVLDGKIKLKVLVNKIKSNKIMDKHI